MKPVKPQISFASVVVLGYNKNVLYPRLITLTKDICGFVGIMALQV